MANRGCLSHFEVWNGKKPVKNVPCTDAPVPANLGKQVFWRERALTYGKFGGGTEIVGMLPAKYGFNPTLLTCLIGLDDHEKKKTNRKQFYNKRWTQIAFGVHKKGKNVYYAITLFDKTKCKSSKKKKILGIKKFLDLFKIKKSHFTTNEKLNKKIGGSSKSKKKKL